MDKFIKFIFFWVFLPAYSTCQASLYLNVLDFGAIGDGSTNNTLFIQAAIDSCFEEGGGEVLIPLGDFVSSTIILKSNVTLRVNGNLVAVTGMGNFPEIPYNLASWSDTYTKKSLIFAEQASHIRLTGSGKIIGSGQDFGVLLENNKNLRPFGIRFHRCVGVLIDSLKFETAPHWMLHIARCDSITIRAIDVYNQGFGSNDGINIDACKHVLIENSVFDCNDDPIAIKTHSEDECSDVLVRNCTIATFERGVKVGNESLGPFKRIRFENITINQSSFPLPVSPQTAIYLAIADGGSADSISFENIQINTAYNTPIFIRLNDRGNNYSGVHPPVQFLRNVLIKNVICQASTTIPCSITGIPGFSVENIRLQNIQLQLPGGGSVGDQNPPENANDRPENDMWGDVLPAYGFFVRHANNVQFDSVCFVLNSPEIRPDYFFSDTSNVIITNPCSSNLESPEIIFEQETVFPNPTSGALNFINGSFKNLKLVSETGQICENCLIGSTNNISLKMEISKLVPNGNYYLVAETSNGKLKIFKISLVR
jgi:hypothetical protein